MEDDVNFRNSASSKDAIETDCEAGGLNGNANGGQVLLTKMDRIDGSMLHGTQKFEKTNQEPKIVISPPDSLLEPNRGWETTPKNLPRGRIFDTGMEWPFGQEISKQLTVQKGVSYEQIIELQIAHAMENENMNEAFVLLGKRDKADENMLSRTLTVEKNVSEF